MSEPQPGERKKLPGWAVALMWTLGVIALLFGVCVVLVMTGA